MRPTFSLGRTTCFTQSIDSYFNPIQTNPHRHTQNNVCSNVWVLRALDKLKHKINHRTVLQLSPFSPVKAQWDLYAIGDKIRKMYTLLWLQGLSWALKLMLRTQAGECFCLGWKRAQACVQSLSHFPFLCDPVDCSMLPCPSLSLSTRAKEWAESLPLPLSRISTFQQLCFSSHYTHPTNALLSVLFL